MKGLLDMRIQTKCNLVAVHTYALTPVVTSRAIAPVAVVLRIVRDRAMLSCVGTGTGTGPIGVGTVWIVAAPPRPRLLILMKGYLSRKNGAVICPLIIRLQTHRRDTTQSCNGWNFL